MLRALRRYGFALLATSGCTQVLGLDEHRYERDPADQGAAASSTGGGGALSGDAGLAAGGGGASPPRRAGSYPFELAATQRIVATTPESSSFYVYDRANGDLDVYNPAPDRFEIIGSWSWVPDFDLVVEVATGNARAALIGYRSASGWVEYVPQPLPGQPLESAPRSGTRHWTHLVPVRLEPTPVLFSYSRESGRFRLGPAEIGSDAEQQLGSWDVRWSSVVGVPSSEGDRSSAALLKFEPETGEAELDEIWLGEGAPARMARGNLGSDWTSATAFMGAGGAHVLLYDARDGRVASGSLAMDGSSMSLSVESTGVWRGGIHQIVPIRIDGVPFAVTHSAGVVDLMQLEPLESSDVTVQ